MSLSAQCRSDLFSMGGGGNIQLGHLEVNAQSQQCPSLVNCNEYKHVSVADPEVLETGA